MKKRIILLIDQTVILLIQGVFFLVPLYFSFFYRNFSVFTLNKTALFKILTASLLILILIRLLMARKITIAPKLKGAVIYLPFFLILLIAGFFSADILNSFSGSYWRQQGVATYLYYLLFIIILLMEVSGRRSINKIINALLFSSLIVSLYGIIQWLGLDSFPWQKAVAAGGRVFSTIGQPVFLGNYLLLVIYLTVYKFIIAENFLKRFLFILLFLSQLLCLIFTYTRGAWLGFAAGSLIILFYIFKNYLSSENLAKRDKFKKAFTPTPENQEHKTMKIIKNQKRGLESFGRKLIVWGFIWPMILLILLAFFLGENNFFIYRLKSMADFGSGSVALRLKYWGAGLEAVLKRPVFGYGPENQQQVILKYYEPSWAIYETIGSSPDRLHNEFLDLAFQGGIFLVLSYLFILFYLFFKAIHFLPKLSKPDRWLLVSLLTGVFSYQIALLSSFSTIDTNPIFWGLTALILIIINGRAFEKENYNLSPERSKQINPAWAVIVVLVIISLAWLISQAINKIKADYYFRLARSAYAQEDYLKMTDNYLKVFNYNPKEKFYSWFFANDIEAALNKINNQNFKKSILVYMKNYLTGNQSDTDNYAELLKRAKMLTLLGYYEDKGYFLEAEKIYDKLVKFNPNIYNTYSAWAGELIYNNNCPRALELYDKALEALPALDSPKLNDEHRQELVWAAIEVYKSRAFCHKELGREENEREEYEKILKLDPYRPDIYDLMAQAYYRLGETDKAIWYNRRGMMLDAKNYRWPLSLSLLYREKKDLAKAGEYLAEAIKLAPENQELRRYGEELNK